VGGINGGVFVFFKNKKSFSVRSNQNISNQINRLKKLFGNDRINYNALFLGEHDVLNAPGQLIICAIQQAFEALGFDRSYMKSKNVFMFASADSVLNSNLSFFEQLNALDAKTYINVGLESCDQATLNWLGKPLSTKKVGQAFERIQAINAQFSNVEITCNFVMDEDLNRSHHDSLIRLIRDSVTRTQAKGCIYLSPLKFSSPSRKKLYDFYKIKSLSRFPTYLYIIQRL